MDNKKSKRFLLTLAALYWALVVIVYLAAGQQFHRTVVTGDSLSPQSIIGEIVDGWEITQRLKAPANQISSVDVMGTDFGRTTNTGVLNLSLSNEQGEEVARGSTPVDAIKNSKYVTLPLEQVGQIHQGESLTLSLTTQGCMPDHSISIYFGNTITTGRFDIAQQISTEDLYTVNAALGAGMLCARLNGVREHGFYKIYWVIVAGIFILTALYVIWGYNAGKKGRNNLVVALCMLYCKYGFLLRQLVSREFKTKYKRSVLGVAWSFLNPLITMAVQYVVFSTLFKGDIPNYPVYLLTGVVFFNFFTEATGMGMTAITSNAALIKKVYMPKYIYPISRLCSSLINLGMALLPLFIVMMFTGTAFGPSLLLLIFDILCMLGFVMGMMLLLSTAMTFFQDTQFLWSVVSMMWMYLTPVFYSDSIIPQNLLVYYHMNPMYQYITFARICIIDGISPEPIAYLWCILSSVIVLMLGIFVFKKGQDKFVMYL